MVGLSLGIVTAYLLGLGTASAVAVIVWLCVKKRSGWYYRLHVLQCFIVLCAAGGTERNTHKDDPLTAANDAYGMQQVIPVYETII